MKKLTFILSGLLLISTSYVFAKEHSEVALEHAKSAALATTAADVVKHAGSALDHTLAAALGAKSIAKNHLNAGADELEKAIDQGNLGQLNSALSHSNLAAEHIAAANSVANSNNSRTKLKNVLE